LKEIAKALSKDKQPFKMKDAFLKADEVLMQCITGVTNIIRNTNAIINLDFADVGTVMRNKGYGHVGIGVGEGENKVRDAIKMAISSPLLETSVIGAKSMIFNCTADENTDFTEVEEAMDELTAQLSPDLEFFYGYVNDESFEDRVVITIIATDLAYSNGEAPTYEKPVQQDTQPVQQQTISEPEFKFVEPTYQQPQTSQSSQSTFTQQTQSYTQTQQSGFTPVSEPTYQQTQTGSQQTGGFSSAESGNKKGGYKIPPFLRNMKK
jgi:cell division protein FtsZ